MFLWHKLVNWSSRATAAGGGGRSVLVVIAGRIMTAVYCGESFFFAYQINGQQKNRHDDLMGLLRRKWEEEGLLCVNCVIRVEVAAS